jgi:hypothetical protein
MLRDFVVEELSVVIFEGIRPTTALRSNPLSLRCLLATKQYKRS